MPEMRKITIPPAVVLPALSTDALERAYPWAAFLSEFVMEARGMQGEGRLTALLDEWEPLYDTHVAPIMREMATSLAAIGKRYPAPPQGDMTAEQIQAFKAEHKAAVETLGAEERSVRERCEQKLDATLRGTCWTVSESAWKAAVDSAKEELDAAQAKDGMGRQRIVPDYIRKILRHYQALLKAEKAAG